MKPRTIIFFFALAAEVGLVLWPFIPGLKSFIPAQPTARDQLEWQITIIGTGFTLLTIGIGAIFHSQERENEEFRTMIEKYLPVTKVAQVRDDEFYSDFLCAAKKAKSAVNIMYLAPQPPDATKDEARLEYYRDLVSVIRRRKDVKFNRIMRLTPENKEWIERLIGELDGCANASLVVIKDAGNGEMPLSLSTQIIDSQKVWLVAIAAHERRGTYRDLFIENDKIAESMQYYFDRLWNRGVKLLDAGRTTPEGRKFLTPKEIAET